MGRDYNLYKWRALVHWVHFGQAKQMCNCVYIAICLKRHLLWSYWANFNETWQKVSPVGRDYYSYKCSSPVENWGGCPRKGEFMRHTFSCSLDPIFNESACWSGQLGGKIWILLCFYGESRVFKIQFLKLMFWAHTCFNRTVLIYLHNNSYLPKVDKPSFQMHISNSLYNKWVVCYHGNKIQQ